MYISLSKAYNKLTMQRVKQLEEQYQEATKTITELKSNVTGMQRIMAIMWQTKNSSEQRVQKVEQSIYLAENRALHFEELHQAACSEDFC